MPAKQGLRACSAAECKWRFLPKNIQKNRAGYYCHKPKVWGSGGLLTVPPGIGDDLKDVFSRAYGAGECIGLMDRMTRPSSSREKTTKAEETLPTSIKEKETHCLKRSVSPLHH
eukprot:89371-Pelagomonas_calceolata.AAC.1